MNQVTLTNDQQNALIEFNQFLTDPVENVFVLSGYSGCGKSTLVRHIVESLPNLTKMIKLIQPSFREYEVMLTATTNKAAESLSTVTGMQAITIHSFLGLRVQTDFKTDTTTLVPRSHIPMEGYLMFVDEASYIDKQLLDLIFKLTNKCKIVFIGDPAQLTPVKSSGTPVFHANYRGAHLSEVVRQAEGNPIIELSTKFRHTVNTGEFFSFTPDGHHIKYLMRDDFDKAIEKEFTRSDWAYKDSKILAWTNKCVINYNHAVSNLVTGDPHFQVGDYAIVNSFISHGRSSFKTDQLVEITGIDPANHKGVQGSWMELDNIPGFFHPDSLTERNARIKQARLDDDLGLVAEIDTSWVDLRAAYACTINKSQGSTFDKVFIDLDDIRRCNSGNQIARMLYVAVSRAKTQVFLTGDIA